MVGKYKLAIIGYGFLSEIIAEAVKDGVLKEHYELVGVLGRTEQKVEAFAQQYGCQACTNIEELMALDPDYTVEASTPEGLKQYAETVLQAKSHIIVLSMGAFSDTNYYEAIKEIAQENNRKIYIASGAVGGFDVIQTAALMGPIEAKMTSKKMPSVLRDTKGFQERILTIKEPEEVFSGTTEDIVDFMPNGLNLSIATALASAGIEKTEMRVIATPQFEGDEYKVEVKGDGVWIEIDVYSRTSAIAGWSVVKILKNIAATVVI